MKVLRVLLIIFMILGVFFTGILFAMKPSVKKEHDFLKNMTGTETQTKLETKIIHDGDKIEFQVKDSDQKYSEKDYKGAIELFYKVTDVGSLVCGGFTVLCLVGIVATTVSIKKRQ